jgi:hypothetical protein
MLGSRGREGAKKQAFNASSVKGGRNFGLLLFAELGGHKGRTGGLYSVSDRSNLRASRCESAAFGSDFRFLNGGTWHVFNGLITRLKNAKIERIAI